MKIAQHYSNPVVHVLDASRAVGVASALLSPTQKDEFVANNNAEHERARVAHARKAPSKPLLSLEVARQRAFKTDWKTVDIAKPAFTGVKVVEDLPLKEIRGYIDWSPFFTRGKSAGAIRRCWMTRKRGRGAANFLTMRRSCWTGCWTRS